jgi:fermentation-respiration switch protein FrsA (DUF1100 family)
MALALKIAAAIAGLYLIFLLGGGAYFYRCILHRTRGQHRAETPERTDPFNWLSYQKEAQAGLDELARMEKEEVSIASFDGLKLRGHLYPVAGARRTFLLVHGYRSTGYNDFNAQAVYYIQALRANVLIIDQRAHGSSEGKRMDFGLSERYDVCAWAEFLTQRFGAEQDLFLNGISMGCASVLLAAELPLPGTVRGVIADCGYTSPWEEFAFLMKWDMHVPIRPLLYVAEGFTRYFAHWDFRSITPKKAVAKLKLPVLFLHGGADTFVPPWMTRENYAACASEKELLIVPGAIHAQSYFGDPPAVQAAIARFVEKHGRYGRQTEQ